jgi:hypothetical protein
VMSPWFDRPTGGFYVTAVNEASDSELAKLYQCERPLPKSEGDREPTSVKTMLSDPEAPEHVPMAIHLQVVRATRSSPSDVGGQSRVLRHRTTR